jgi:hypothetical protein
VARVLGVELVSLPMLPDPSRSVPPALDATDAQYRVDQTWGREMAERAAADGCDLLLDGLAFDAILGSTFRSPGDDPEHLARSLDATFRNAHPDVVRALAGDDAARAVEESVARSLNAAAAESLGAAGPLASEHFVMNQRIRRYTFGYCLANLSRIACAFPYVTRELFEHCITLPASEREASRLYRRIYCERFPELAAIPWAKTGRPLHREAPTGARRARTLVEAAVRRASGGRVNLEARRQWSFDDDFRNRPGFGPFFSDVLERNAGRLAGCLPAETVGRLLRAERSGRNYGELIQALVSALAFMEGFGVGGRV